MEEYLKNHENFICKTLENQGNGYDWNGLRDFHQTQIAYMQHERLVHLLVTLAFGLFALISVLFTIATEKIELIPVDLLLLVLLIPYIKHYVRLENGIQRWYHLDNQLAGKCGKMDVCYENKKKGQKEK